MSDTEQQDFSDIIETLEQLEQGLIEYEDALQDDTDDGSIIHIIFRYAHNLKSSLGMAHKKYCSELTHSIENNFDLIRSGKMVISRELIDKSLHAIDLIKANLFRDPETMDDLIKLKEEFDSFKDTYTEKREATINFLLTDEQKVKIADDAASGKSIYMVEKLIKTDIDKEGYENLPIYEDIKELGSLIAVHPSFENISRKSEESIVKIVFSTGMTPDDLYFEIFDPLHEIHFDVEAGADGGIDAEGQEPEKGIPAAADKLNDLITTKKAVKKDLRFLIVEDDFTTRHLEMKILGEYGSSEVAVDGKEAVSAFEKAMLEETPYDCIFLDIIIPGFDGHEVLRRIREFEAERGVLGFDRTTVIIVSNLKDMENISKSFREQSDSYIVKPFSRKKVEWELQRLQLI